MSTTIASVPASTRAAVRSKKSPVTPTAAATRNFIEGVEDFDELDKELELIVLVLVLVELLLDRVDDDFVLDDFVEDEELDALDDVELLAELGDWLDVVADCVLDDGLLTELTELGDWLLVVADCVELDWLVVELVDFVLLEIELIELED